MIKLEGKVVAFICYWSITEPLTVATILPQIHVLKRFYKVKEVILYTIERGNSRSQTDGAESTLEFVHKPLNSIESNVGLFNKIADFTFFPQQIATELKRSKASAVLAHCAPAGALAYLVWKKSKVPFIVTSFEPHAEYMAESGVWKRNGLKYSLQKYWEKQQKRYATGIATASEGYRRALLTNGVPAERLLTLPCTVKTSLFSFSRVKRATFREKHDWQTSVTGIYAGKFGDLYYKEEAFEIYKKCFELIPNFRLIILSPQPETEIRLQLKAHGIDESKVHVASVPHDEVPAYLSAADFAFATYKPGPSKKYLSPIKIGEYWANGLPVLLTEGIGDDSEIIEREGGGALFNLHKNGSVEHAIVRIMEIMKDPGHRQEIPKLAHKYRSPERIKEAYEYFFGNGQEVKE